MSSFSHCSIGLNHASEIGPESWERGVTGSWILTITQGVEL
jgi:hypothetical protein